MTNFNGNKFQNINQALEVTINPISGFTIFEEMEIQQGIGGCLPALNCPAYHSSLAEFTGLPIRDVRRVIEKTAKKYLNLMKEKKCTQR